MDIDIDMTFRGCGVLMFKSKYLFCLKYECKISRQFVSYLYFFSDTCGHRFQNRRCICPSVEKVGVVLKRGMVQYSRARV